MLIFEFEPDFDLILYDSISMNEWAALIPWSSDRLKVSLGLNWVVGISWFYLFLTFACMTKS